MNENAGNTIGPKAPRDRKDVKAMQKTAVDLLIRLHLVLKISKLYEPNNDMLQEQAKLLFEGIGAVIAVEDEAAFKVRQSAIFFNGFRVKFVFSNYAIFKFVLEEFRKREIGAMSFLSGLTQDELIRFMIVFAKKEKKASVSFEEIAGEVRETGIDHVVLEKFQSNETFTSLEKNTASTLLI